MVCAYVACNIVKEAVSYQILPFLSPTLILAVRVRVRGFARVRARVRGIEGLEVSGRVIGVSARVKEQVYLRVRIDVKGRRINDNQYDHTLMITYIPIYT